jgi:hypothetical protein
MLDILFNTLGEEEQHKWTDKELIDALRYLNWMILIILQNWLNPDITDLAVTTQHLSWPIASLTLV